ncbi:pectinesterase inhibitor 5-like [Castanea sativa]|uniref:pectinesterase inhibitor 5-like n=1 Tax=Castanea sativa TaxID=21020 RepID=UPI003F6530B8
MASPISCISILIIPLLVTSLFYDVSNADRPLLEKVCKQTFDHDFCMSVLLSDPEGLTNVLYRLGLVSTSVSLKIISTTNGEIGNVLIGVTDPVDRTRISNCQTDIDDVYDKMQLARNAAGSQSYWEEARILASAKQKIIDCEKQFESSPKHASPISDHTYKITKLINISVVIINMLLSS